ncbi:uncharacterized protein LOC133294073 [Gastrolobium bilobum]|uniref:uncharacterized protein LOC133294073 n=1 Tax=Gastrolobium bilobum TaxID=150636 RepID=UPI002AB203E4|nr:uncharacterized protein LOC133294073 [Gastrolobium bilobum]
MDIVGPFPVAVGGVKWLLVAIDYFFKWIEAEALATISANKVRRFFYRQIISRFGVPHTIITYNGTQFVDRKFNQVLQDLHVKHRYTSVEHPQMNGLAESANRVLKRGLERRLEAAKGEWPEQLDFVLWGYRTTKHSTTGETPFRMVYGSEAMILVEIGEPSWRKMYTDSDNNSQALLHNLDTGSLTNPPIYKKPLTVPINLQGSLTNPPIYRKPPTVPINLQGSLTYPPIYRKPLTVPINLQGSLTNPPIYRKPLPVPIKLQGSLMNPPIYRKPLMVPIKSQGSHTNPPINGIPLTVPNNL